MSSNPYAAPAPAADDDDADDYAAASTEYDDTLHALAEAWVRWCHTRKLYASLRPPPSLLGQLAARRRSLGQPGGPDAVCSAELSAWHLAYISQPDALDRQVFELHYWQRVKPIGAAARALGISRAQWYVLLRDFRRRVHAQALEIADSRTSATPRPPA